MQLTMSVFLVVCTIALFQQLNFVRKMDKGFFTSDIMVSSFRVTEARPSLASNYRQLKEKLAREPWVVSSSLSTGVPFLGIDYREVDIFRDGKVNKYMTGTIAADRDFILTYGLSIVDGIDLSGPDLPRGACVVNESACLQFGWDQPLGEEIGSDSLVVVGVVKDFHYGDLNWAIGPLVIRSLGEEEVKDNMVFSVRFASGIPGIAGKERHSAMADSIATSVIPDFDIQLKAIEDLIPYDFITGISDGFLMFSLIALFIAAIGLFGLISYNIERERRETGIRKAYGCTSSEIVLRVLSRYTRLLLISMSVGSLLALALVGRIMTIFAYRNTLGLSPFMLTFTLFSLVMILSVSGSAMKSAFANPAESIRHD
ncbi:MAG: FtsX-like permease family protein [Bacteroidales bacterium]